MLSSKETGSGGDDTEVILFSMLLLLAVWDDKEVVLSSVLWLFSVDKEVFVESLLEIEEVSEYSSDSSESEYVSVVSSGNFSNE